MVDFHVLRCVVFGSDKLSKIRMYVIGTVKIMTLYLIGAYVDVVYSSACRTFIQVLVRQRVSHESRSWRHSRPKSSVPCQAAWCALDIEWVVSGKPRISVLVRGAAGGGAESGLWYQRRQTSW